MDIPTPIPTLCPQCHQSVAPGVYFCPNCGKNLNEPPLSTGVWAQILLYGFSIVLPIIAFLLVSKWQGMKYMRSDDPVAKQIGIVAAVLMALSTIISFWLFFVWLNQAVQSSLSSVGNLSGL